MRRPIVAAAAALLLLVPSRSDAAADETTDREECICIPTTLLAEITTFVPCASVGTADFGVFSIPGTCKLPCTEMYEPCGFGVYAHAEPKPGCSVGCDVEFRSPPWKPGWGSDLSISVLVDCGASDTVSVLSRCNALCTGSCAGAAKIFGSTSLECSPCTHQ
jgi:hypothetical protein